MNENNIKLSNLQDEALIKEIELIIDNLSINNDKLILFEAIDRICTYKGKINQLRELLENYHKTNNY